MSSDNRLSLGIAKIGDLLIEKKITTIAGEGARAHVLLKIPIYQRPYKWTAKHAIQLLDDIIEAHNGNKEVYRVGTLILHYDAQAQVYDVVDGQQRITTFALLLKALGESQIPFLQEKLADNSYTQRNIANNYATFVRRCNNMMEERKREGLKERTISDRAGDRILSDLRAFIKQQCEFVVVITSDISEAFQFFDSQNARGKELYPHDLLKAYHLREMRGLDEAEIERIVHHWENIDQWQLSNFFSEYLFRLRAWVKQQKAWKLNEQNMDSFKGVSAKDNYPYAQFYKGAHAYAEMVNHSAMPFVTGIHELRPFQLTAPILAGKPFFDFTYHYFDILKDIQNNDKYVGYFINGNDIVKTLDLPHYRNGIGNRIARQLFDLAALLYVDRFCPSKPTLLDIDLFEQFVVLDFIWAYSLRLQYANLGWVSAQNYIMGNGLTNAFNLYRLIAEAISPEKLLSKLADKVCMLPATCIKDRYKKDVNAQDGEGIYTNFLHYFVEYQFYIQPKDE